MASKSIALHGAGGGGSGGAPPPNLTRAALELYEAKPIASGSEPGAPIDRIPFQFNPKELSINEEGGRGTVAVSAGAGCGWTATSNESWITITDGASGSGNGTVRYNVGSTNGKKRTGTLTIAGRTFTVDQDKKND